MPGSGKSTIGRSLASHLGIPFFDLDKLIETSECKSITEIFSNSGEENFRTIESSELRRIVDSPAPFVLATGGGTPCFHNNMELLIQSGFTVFLDPPLDLLKQRLTNSKGRPLINSDDPIAVEEKLKRLIKLRLPFYERASLRITEDSIPADRLAQLIP